MAEPTELTVSVGDAQPGIERARMILTELTDAAQSAALSLVGEQKTRAAAQVGGVAAAVRAAARSLEGSQSSVAAGYAHCAAREIEAFAATIRERHWDELAADVKMWLAASRPCSSPARSRSAFWPAAFCRRRRAGRTRFFGCACGRRGGRRRGLQRQRERRARRLAAALGSTGAAVNPGDVAPEPDFAPDPEGMSYRPRLDRSIGTMFGELADDLGKLFRLESALFKLELSEKARRLSRGLIALAIGGCFALGAWLVLLAAAVLGLATVLRPGSRR